MEKAFDLKVLAEKLKAAGLPEAEMIAEKSYEAFKNWVKESVEKTPSPYDDLVLALFTSLDKVVLPALEKIDGQ